MPSAQPTSPPSLPRQVQVCVIVTFEIELQPPFNENATSYPETVEALRAAVAVSMGVDPVNIQVATNEAPVLCGEFVATGSTVVATANTTTPARQLDELVMSSVPIPWTSPPSDSTSTDRVETALAGINLTASLPYPHPTSSSPLYTDMKPSAHSSAHAHRMHLTANNAAISFAIVSNAGAYGNDLGMTPEALEANITASATQAFESGAFGIQLVYYSKVYEADVMLEGPGVDSISDVRTAAVAVAVPVIIDAPTSNPTTQEPSSFPSKIPTTSRPTKEGETNEPTPAPTSVEPTSQPSGGPTFIPTSHPSGQPSTEPTSPTSMPSALPTNGGYIEAQLEDEMAYSILFGVIVGLIGITSIGYLSYQVYIDRQDKIVRSRVYIDWSLNEDWDPKKDDGEEKKTDMYDLDPHLPMYSDGWTSPIIALRDATPTSSPSHTAGGDGDESFFGASLDPTAAMTTVDGTVAETRQGSDKDLDGTSPAFVPKVKPIPYSLIFSPAKKGATNAKLSSAKAAPPLMVPGKKASLDKPETALRPRSSDSPSPSKLMSAWDEESLDGFESGTVKFTDDGKDRQDDDDDDNASMVSGVTFTTRIEHSLALNTPQKYVRIRHVLPTQLDSAASALPADQHAELDDITPMKLQRAIVFLKPGSSIAGMQYLLTSALFSADVRVLSIVKYHGADIARLELFSKHFFYIEKYAVMTKASDVRLSLDEQKAFYEGDYGTLPLGTALSRPQTGSLASALFDGPSFGRPPTADQTPTSESMTQAIYAELTKATPTAAPPTIAPATIAPTGHNGDSVEGAGDALVINDGAESRPSTGMTARLLADTPEDSRLTSRVSVREDAEVAEVAVSGEEGGAEIEVLHGHEADEPTGRLNSPSVAFSAFTDVKAFDESAGSGRIEPHGNGGGDGRGDGRGGGRGGEGNNKPETAATTHTHSSLGSPKAGSMPGSPKSRAVSTFGSSRPSTSGGNKMTWDEALSTEVVYNAVEATSYLNIDHASLNRLWVAAGSYVRVRKGFSVARLHAGLLTSCPEVTEAYPELEVKLLVPVYVINGYFNSMKEQYLDHSATVNCYEIEWDGLQVSWQDLLHKVIGNRDPKQALPTSVRGKAYRQWKKMGMRCRPDLKDNCIHVSSSAFVGLVDRLVWVKDTMLFTDVYGARLVAAHVPIQTLQLWLTNPVIQNRPVFDHMYGLEADKCVQKAEQLLMIKAKPEPSDFVKSQLLKNPAFIPPINKFAGTGIFAKQNSSIESTLLVLKPDWDRPSMVTLIGEVLKSHGVTASVSSLVGAEEMIARSVIKNQYARLYRFAEEIRSITLSPEEKSHFLTTFDTDWDDVWGSSQVYNAHDIRVELQISDSQLDALCRRSSSPTIQLQSGLFVSRIDTACTDDPRVQRSLLFPLFIVNGFYGAMRDSYTEGGRSSRYMKIEWDAEHMSWSDMLVEVIGDKNPYSAAPSSIRGRVFREWESLGFEQAPTLDNNIIHCSASSFAAMVDRLVWIKGAMLYTDLLGARLLSARIPVQHIQKWLENPTVQDKRVFVHMLRLGSSACIDKAHTLIETSHSKRSNLIGKLKARKQATVISAAVKEVFSPKQLPLPSPTPIPAPQPPAYSEDDKERKRKGSSSPIGDVKAATPPPPLPPPVQSLEEKLAVYEERLAAEEALRTEEAEIQAQLVEEADRQRSKRAFPGPPRATIADTGDPDDPGDIFGFNEMFESEEEEEEESDDSRDKGVYDSPTKPHRDLTSRIGPDRLTESKGRDTGGSMDMGMGMGMGSRVAFPTSPAEAWSMALESSPTRSLTSPPTALSPLPPSSLTFDMDASGVDLNGSDNMMDIDMESSIEIDLSPSANVANVQQGKQRTFTTPLIMEPTLTLDELLMGALTGVTPSVKLSSPTVEEGVGGVGVEGSSGTGSATVAASRSAVADVMEYGVLFLKPSVTTHVKVLPVIEAVLESFDVKISSSGKWSGLDMGRKNIIQNQYPTFFKFATDIDPSDIILSVAETTNFRESYKAEWYDLMMNSQVFNAKDACDYLKCSELALAAMCKNPAAKRIKLRRGLFCARLDKGCTNDNSVKLRLMEPVYVMNGFHADLTAAYTAPSHLTYYFILQWNGRTMTWPEVHENVIGTSDPAQSSSRSIRGSLIKRWDSLKIAMKPSIADNCVHMSRSAFEGLAERLIWDPSALLYSDPFGRKLISARVAVPSIQHWCTNPHVNGYPVFDHFEWLDSVASIAAAKAVTSKSASKKLSLIQNLMKLKKPGAGVGVGAGAGAAVSRPSTSGSDRTGAAASPAIDTSKRPSTADVVDPSRPTSPIGGGAAFPLPSPKSILKRSPSPTHAVGLSGRTLIHGSDSPPISPTAATAATAEPAVESPPPTAAAFAATPRTPPPAQASPEKGGASTSVPMPGPSSPILTAPEMAIAPVTAITMMAASQGLSLKEQAAARVRARKERQKEEKLKKHKLEKIIEKQSIMKEEENRIKSEKANEKAMKKARLLAEVQAADETEDRAARRRAMGLTGEAVVAVADLYAANMGAGEEKGKKGKKGKKEEKEEGGDGSSPSKRRKREDGEEEDGEEENEGGEEEEGEEEEEEEEKEEKEESPKPPPKPIITNFLERDPSLLPKDRILPQKGDIFAKRFTQIEHCALFIKPLFNTPEVLEHVVTAVESHGMKVVSQRRVTGQEIEAKKMIDSQYATFFKIAEDMKVTSNIRLSPEEMNRFSCHFPDSWMDQAEKGRVVSAKAAGRIINLNAEGVYEMCTKSHADFPMLKLRKGLYVSRIDKNYHRNVAIKAKLEKPLYVVNCFYEELRRSYADEQVVNYMVLEFDSQTVGWSDFLSKIIGIDQGHSRRPLGIGGSPIPAGSVCGSVYQNYEELGITGEALTGLIVDNTAADGGSASRPTTTATSRPATSATATVAAHTARTEVASRPMTAGSTLTTSRSSAGGIGFPGSSHILHVSGSAFAGLKDRLIWSKDAILYTDLFGARLMTARFKSNLINIWLSDPVLNDEYTAGLWGVGSEVGVSVLTFLHGQDSQQTIDSLKRLSDATTLVQPVLPPAKSPRGANREAAAERAKQWLTRGEKSKSSGVTVTTHTLSTVQSLTTSDTAQRSDAQAFAAAVKEAASAPPVKPFLFQQSTTASQLTRGDSLGGASGKFGSMSSFGSAYGSERTGSPGVGAGRSFSGAYGGAPMSPMASLSIDQVLMASGSSRKRGGAATQTPPLQVSPDEKILSSKVVLPPLEAWGGGGGGGSSMSMKSGISGVTGSYTDDGDASVYIGSPSVNTWNTGAEGTEQRKKRRKKRKKVVDA